MFSVIVFFLLLALVIGADSPRVNSWVTSYTATLFEVFSASPTATTEEHVSEPFTDGELVYANGEQYDPNDCQDWVAFHGAPKAKGEAKQRGWAAKAQYTGGRVPTMEERAEHIDAPTCKGNRARRARPDRYKDHHRAELRNLERRLVTEQVELYA